MTPRPHRSLLSLDTGSPVVSVAMVAADGTLQAERSVAQRESSQTLLRLVDEGLREARTTLPEVGGVVALQGPGSFTGLRIGLATVQGLSQALGLPATAVPTLQTLAFHAATAGAQGTVLALVDAVRGGWFVQPFALPTTGNGLPTPVAEPERRPAADLAALADAVGATALWGFGTSDLQSQVALPCVEPSPLAAAGARLALAAPELWDPHRLTTPLYLRAPAVTLPKPHRRPFPAPKAP